MIMKTKKIFLNLYIIFSILLLFVAVYIYNLSRDYSSVYKHKNLGNTAEIINSLGNKESKIPFSFAFISDTENSDGSLWLISNLLKSDVDFLVFCGDFVNHSVLSEHKLFLYNIAKLDPKVPIFLVPSNHDMDFHNTQGNSFKRQDFENLYGPENFSFEYNKCLFVFLSNILQDGEEANIFLENVLSKRNKDIRKTFVFSPTPSRAILNKVFPESPAWMSEQDKILDKYGVDYVISGDYHRNLEFRGVNNTEYIVSGPGGSHFYPDSIFGRIKCASKITVYPDGIMRELLVCDTIIITDNSIRHFIYNKLSKYFETKTMPLNLVLTVIILNALFAVYKFIKGIKL